MIWIAIAVTGAIVGLGIIKLADAYEDRTRLLRDIANEFLEDEN